VDELIRQMTEGPLLDGGFGVWETLAALTLSFSLNLLLAYFYRQSHRGLSYSVSFVHAMVLMGMTISIIMLIIGSNIARAFTLVGALSIIRFRNAVKDSRDVAFIFVAMAIGMAVGTGFYQTAVIFTLFACAAIYVLSRFEVGAIVTREVLLKVHLPAAKDYHSVFEELFFRYLRDASLLSVETVQDGTVHELVYSIEFKDAHEESEFLEAMRILTENRKVALLVGQENINV
jgi:uncharacterized membrane protein YhiD involved in acid resistance